MITIDLPCNIGDKLYYIENGIIHEPVVMYASKTGNDEVVKCADEYCRGYTFRKGNFGYCVFLTKEEAEAKIKENDVND